MPKGMTGGEKTEKQAIYSNKSLNINLFSPSGFAFRRSHLPRQREAWVRTARNINDHLQSGFTKQLQSQRKDAKINPLSMGKFYQRSVIP